MLTLVERRQVFQNLQLLLSTQHKVHFGHIGYILGLKLSITTRYHHESIGVLASNATDGLTAFLVGKFSNRTSIDNTNIGLFSGTSLPYTLFSKELTESRSLGKVQLTTQRIKYGCFILKYRGVNHS